MVFQENRGWWKLDNIYFNETRLGVGSWN